MASAYGRRVHSDPFDRYFPNCQKCRSSFLLYFEGVPTKKSCKLAGKANKLNPKLHVKYSRFFMNIPLLAPNLDGLKVEVNALRYFDISLRSR